MQHTTQERRVSIFRNGRNQAIRIPREFEFKGKEAIIRKEGNRLIIEELSKMKLIELLDSLDPLDEADEPLDFNDDGLLPLDDIKL